MKEVKRNAMTKVTSEISLISKVSEIPAYFYTTSRAVIANTSENAIAVETLIAQLSQQIRKQMRFVSK